mgnify:CR=1 FL=1
MPVIKILPHPEYCPQGAEITAPAGTSICEAMLARLPVVATAVGGVAEAVVEGQTGLLVPPDDVAALVRALGIVLADKTLRTQMGAAARERALQEFSAPVMARAYEALYAEITNR